MANESCIKTYTLCGSMKFEKEMMEIAYQLETRKGYNILQCVYCKDDSIPTKDELSLLEAAHYRKIDLSDGIYIVNIGGYIGKSVKKEIQYAQSRNKEIIYHEPHNG